MSVSSQINRINANIASAYTAVSGKGGTLPSARNSNNLAAAIQSIVISTGVTVFGAIVVDFPAGSTCTCSNGTTTYTAGSTGGNWVFTVPSAGTWTVTATKGTETNSKAVSITTQGQGIAITISFWDGTLFDNGNSYEAYTGGWSARAWKAENAWTADAPTINGNASYMVDGMMLIQESGTTKSGVVETLQDVDLTDWNTFNVTVASNYLYSSGSGARFSLVAVPRTATLWWTNAAAKTESTSTIAAGTYSLDISAVSGSYDLVLGLKTGISSQSGNVRFNISKIWLA